MIWCAASQVAGAHEALAEPPGEQEEHAVHVIHVRVVAHGPRQNADGRFERRAIPGGTIDVAVGLAELFETVVGSGDVARHKPAPDVYLEAAQRLGVDPGRCIAFDDADGGLESARRAGMAVVDVRTIWQPADRLFTA